MADAPPDILARMQEKKFERYREILSNGKDEGEFWDAVLITAADDGQAGIFRDQLSSRLELGYLPTSTQYHVISDPPGPKIGNGGATLVALDWLRSRFGDAVRAMKILLIHAGGYSQRTPNHSVCGKIFAPLPVGPVAGTTMLEMCLAMLCDIPRRASPGIMVKCGDDIIIFDSEFVDFTRPGFSALAHRSPVEVAYTHGVFCLPAILSTSSSLQQCRRFTHKPSMERMRKYGALLDGKEEEAYTDSSFFFDWTSADRLLKWFDERNGVIGCEIDAYGDFLQALGPEADSAYCEDSSNALGSGSISQKARRQVFEALQGLDLWVCLLDQSRFWHIGTLPELLHHFCARDSFLHEAGALKQECGYTLKNGPHGLLYYSTATPKTAIVCSRLEGNDAGQISPGAFIELSVLGAGSKVGQGSFVSSSVLAEHTIVPPGIFLHTLAVFGVDKSTCFTSHILGIEDDIKATASADKVLWAGVSLKDVCSLAGLSLNNVWDGKDRGSLWEARIFPVAGTRQDCAKLSLSILKAATQPATSTSAQLEWAGVTFTSFKESMASKDSATQLKHRKGLAV